MICKVCFKETILVKSFGEMPIANDFNLDSLRSSYRYELVAAFCDSCKTFQLSSQPDPKLMFHESYKFLTGTSAFMKRHFMEMFNMHVPEDFYFNKNRFILEIGSNDGTFLENIQKHGIPYLGLDPSENVVKVAQDKGLVCEVAFFDSKAAKYLSDKKSKADIVFASNVVCHIAEIMDFAIGIKTVLKPDGLFVFEEPYLGSMLDLVSYDQLYDEHVFMFSLQSINEIFGRVEMQLVDAIPQPTHGGSMRYVVAHKDAKIITSRAKSLIEKEVDSGLNTISSMTQFSLNCDTKKAKLLNLLISLKAENKRVFGYAATSKSTTIINFCGIDKTLITGICDSTLSKIGTLTPGSDIPIVSRDELIDARPDVIILFAWNHKEEIYEKERTGPLSKCEWIMLVPDIKIGNM